MDLEPNVRRLHGTSSVNGKRLKPGQGSSGICSFRVEGKVFCSTGSALQHSFGEFLCFSELGLFFEVAASHNLRHPCCSVNVQHA